MAKPEVETVCVLPRLPELSLMLTRPGMAPVKLGANDTEAVQDDPSNEAGRAVAR